MLLSSCQFSDFVFRFDSCRVHHVVIPSIILRNWLAKHRYPSVPKVGSHTDHLLHVSFSPTSRIELKRQGNLRAIKQNDRNILVTIRSNSCHDFVRVQLVTRELQTDTSVATCLQKCIQSHHRGRSRHRITFPCREIRLRR